MSAHARVAPGLFPPELVVQIKALACELPATRGLPLSRLSTGLGTRLSVFSFKRSDLRVRTFSRDRARCTSRHPRHYGCRQTAEAAPPQRPRTAMPRRDFEARLPQRAAPCRHEGRPPWATTNYQLFVSRLIEMWCARGIRTHGLRLRRPTRRTAIIDESMAPLVQPTMTPPLTLATTGLVARTSRLNTTTGRACAMP